MIFLNKFHFCDRPVKVFRIRRWVAGVIVGFMFGCIGILFALWVDIKDLQGFDLGRSYAVCIGANDQIKQVVNGLLTPTSVPPDATPAQRMSTELANQRLEQRASELNKIVEAARGECKIYLE